MLFHKLLFHKRANTKTKTKMCSLTIAIMSNNLLILVFTDKFPHKINSSSHIKLQQRNNVGLNIPDVGYINCICVSEECTS